MTSFPTRHALLSATALAGALLLAACSGGSVHVAAPATTGSAAKQCAALRSALPAKLAGLKLRGTTPKSANTAAWGSPAIVLRCGVGIPGVIDPTSSTFDPDYGRHDVEEVKGVCWVSEPLAGGAYRFTTVKQQAYVELTVPGAYAGQQSPVDALTGAIDRADPVDASRPFACV